MFWFGFSRDALLDDPKRLGRWGEKRSERFLKRKGFEAIARNFTCKTGEIDLIMTDQGRTIVFVEVKTRRDENYSQAQDAVTYAKRAKMIRTARHFLKTYEVKDKPMRFDVVAVVLGPKGPVQIRHYENAFRP